MVLMKGIKNTEIHRVFLPHFKQTNKVTMEQPSTERRAKQINVMPENG